MEEKRGGEREGVVHKHCGHCSDFIINKCYCRQTCSLMSCILIMTVFVRSVGVSKYEIFNKPTLSLHCS